MHNNIPQDALHYLHMNIQKGLFYGEIVAIRKRMIEATDGSHTIYVSYSDLATKFERTPSGLSFVEKKV